MTRYVGYLVELTEPGRILENASEQLLASLDRAIAQVVGIPVREVEGENRHVAPASARLVESHLATKREQFAEGRLKEKACNRTRSG